MFFQKFSAHLKWKRSNSLLPSKVAGFEQQNKSTIIFLLGLFCLVSAILIIQVLSYKNYVAVLHFMLFYALF